MHAEDEVVVMDFRCVILQIRLALYDAHDSNIGRTASREVERGFEDEGYATVRLGLKLDR